MGGGGKRSRPVVQPVPDVSDTEGLAQEAGKEARRRQAKKKGRRSTLLTGSQGRGDIGTTSPTLLSGKKETLG